jgi:uncharacterized protein (UPF0264 family)
MLIDPPKLLVSVRSVVEAEAALAGGADVIDVKEPARGALGRADDAVLEDIRIAIAGRRPVSAALGELRDFANHAPTRVDFVKCGLAGLASDPTWPRQWERFREAAGMSQAVFVAYADAECAHAPPVDDVVALACARPGSILLVDTCCKDASVHGRRATLLDWLPTPWLAALIDRIHRANGRVALAGSLAMNDIVHLRGFRADWIAIRGAACRDGDRGASIDLRRVRQIKELLRGEFAG